VSGPELVLYTRPGCHLCEEARDLLDSLRGSPPSFWVREVDIESDDRLLARYLERIPVIEAEGQVIGELILDADALRAKLDTLGR
jgi:glutaredoxin